MVARGSMLELLRIDPDTDKLVSSALQTAGLCYTRGLSNCTSPFHKFMLRRPVTAVPCSVFMVSLAMR